MKRGLLLLSVVFLVAFAGCSKSTTIKEITDNPREFVDQEVTIKGNVTDRLSLLVVSYFEIDDGTGSIKVITDKPLPNVGNTLTVTGTVTSFTLGTESLYVIQEQSSQ